MRKFITIPQRLILDKSLGEKRVIVYSAIYFLNSKDLTSLASYSGYSTCRSQPGVLSQYKTVISSLVSQNYMKETGRGMVYNRPRSNFGIVTLAEFERIVEYRKASKQDGKLPNHAVVLLLLAYIRLRMIHSPDCPEMYSDLLSRISENTGLSVRAVSLAIDTLMELGIIYNEELPRYTGKDGQWHSSVRIFVNMESQTDEHDWRENLSRAKELILCAQHGGKKVGIERP